MGTEIKITCDECGRTIHLDDATYCFECIEKAKNMEIIKAGSGQAFINHLQAHLPKDDGSMVICKICGKTAKEIIAEAMK